MKKNNFKPEKNKLFFKPKNFYLKVNNSSRLIPIGKVYCVGRNYPDHALEMNEEVEKKEPFFFTKPPQSLTQKKVIEYPSNTCNLQHEIELVIVIGSECANISSKDALDYIFGCAVGIDLTKRDIQKIAKENRKPWDLSKGFDNSAPISLINRDILDYEKLQLRLSVNQEIKQSGSTSSMIWNVRELISYLSNQITLHPGDLIFTGTPSGVGPINKGDKIFASIKDVGSIDIKFR